MEDIYDDLDNYNDVNAVEELRNENKELKFKLQEYATSIEKLQKDYDMLSSEFKTFEINYSSLLKTAKAEIERKTQIINNLNREKDMMLLNSIQNNDKSILKMSRNFNRDRNCFKTKRDEIDGKNKIAREMPEPVKVYSPDNRIEENRLPSIDTVTSGNTDDTINKFENVMTKIDKLDSKENVNKLKSRPQSIKNRRKSMGMDMEKFSTDEEFDNYNISKKDWAPREEQRRRISDRKYKDQQSHKISETSGIDEKYSSYHESSRETYCKGQNRYNDKYRGRDKYDRYRKNYSPERFRRAREPPDGQYYRQDYGRHRVLESPPLERYDERQRRNRDRRPYEKGAFEDRSKCRTEKPPKHKLQIDFDEALPKRARTDSLTRQFEEDYQRIGNEMSEQPMISKPFEHLQVTTCQSPDFNADEDSTHAVREIMSTASIELDDPRLSSKKYFTKKENDKLILSVVNGREVDLKPIKCTEWDMQQVEVPKALQVLPSNTDNLIHELYSDIDSQNCNMSVESGEILSETNDPFYFGKSKKHKEYEQISNTAITHESRKDKLTVETPVVCHKESKPTEPSNVLEPIAPIKYRIPKKSDVKPGKPLNILINEMETSERKKSSKGNKDLKKGNKNNLHKVNTLEKVCLPVKEVIDEKTNQQRLSTEQNQLSYRHIVEGDLELSDETSDATSCKTPAKNKSATKNVDSNKYYETYDNRNTKEFQIEVIQESIGRVEDNCEFQNNKDETKPVDVADKKQKPKKSLKMKISKQSCKIVETDEPIDKKNSKKETSLEIKAKFSDLFGDSSSLITPEDLNSNPKSSSPLLSNCYVPIFEDAIDANDVYVHKLQASSEVNVLPIPMNKSNEESKAEKQNKSKPNKHKTTVDSKKRKSKNSVSADLPDLPAEEQVNKALKTGENAAVPLNLDTQKLSENLNSFENVMTNNAKDVDVVQTVIISSGVQPQSMVEGKVDVEPAVANVVLPEIMNAKDLMEKIRMQALATSTPYKPVDAGIELRPSESGRVQTEVPSPANQSTASTDLDSQTEPEPPDVRLFVKRRRKKVIKQKSAT